MAIKSETFPITLQIKPDSTLNLKSSSVKINLEKSNIEIYNDRGGKITTTDDKNRLFIDNNNLLIGYLWDTGTSNDDDSRFNVQDYYLFTFLVAIDYSVTEQIVSNTGETTEQTTTNTFILSYSTKKLLEANTTLQLVKEG